LQIGSIADAGFYIFVDGSVLTVKPAKLSTALVDLLCCFFCFNAEYPSQLKTFFTFAEVLLFDRSTPLAAKSAALLCAIKSL
jgi:hypothetical protein